MSRLARLLSVFTLVAVAGCQDPGTGFAPEPSRSAYQRTDIGLKRGQSAQLEESLGPVAEALATALQSSARRQDIVASMRSSPFVEHKLVLQELLRASPALIEAVARAAGTDALTLAARLDDLPPLDFYMPVTLHRRSWRATDDILIGYTAEVNRAEFTALTLDGQRHHVTQRTAPAPVLILHPAEVKDVRAHTQAAVYGDVVEDPDDGSVGGLVTVYERGVLISRSTLQAESDNAESNAIQAVAETR